MTQFSFYDRIWTAAKIILTYSRCDIDAHIIHTYIFTICMYVCIYIPQVDEQMSDELIEKIAPNCNKALRFGWPTYIHILYIHTYVLTLYIHTIRRSLYNLGNPLQSLKKLHSLIGDLCVQLEILSNEQGMYVCMYVCMYARMYLCQQDLSVCIYVN